MFIYADRRTVSHLNITENDLAFFSERITVTQSN
jgi:hypothetical protein